MTELDDKIKAALGKESPTGDEQLIRDVYNPNDELSVRELLVTTFHGKLRWMAYLVYTYIVLFMALAIYSGVQFFQAEANDVKSQILYATLFGLAILVVSIVKLWYWMLMNRNAVNREIKRLELQIAKLSQQLKRD